jgi:hypothetical protein
MFLFATISRAALGSIECPGQWIHGEGINQSESEASHLHLFNTN